MRYYVVSDIHGFYDEFVSALESKGYFNDSQEKKLIVLGDIIDRGEKPLEIIDFISSLIDNDEVILIKGNHEDLYEELVNNFSDQWFYRHHALNGTLQTSLTIANMSFIEAVNSPDIYFKRNISSLLSSKIIPAMKDYYETNNYIFVHGFIPIKQSSFSKNNSFINDWRIAKASDWENARWLNGMDLWKKGYNKTDKTIVCGHWHCSYGNYYFHKKGIGESDKELSCFEPFIDDGIIAIDACTAISKKVNCIVIED